LLLPCFSLCCLQLCDLYENDCIFDKFDCCMNGAATYVASGSYNNSFKVFKCAEGSQGTPLEATRDPMRRRLQPVRVSSSGSNGMPCGAHSSRPVFRRGSLPRTLP
jgi:serine/threonine-protein phosphatase 2A regulatory subunit B